KATAETRERSAQTRYQSDAMRSTKCYTRAFLECFCISYGELTATIRIIQFSDKAGFVEILFF
ncbi:hypothetical protein, partial [Natronobacterium gregoryi]